MYKPFTNRFQVKTIAALAVGLALSFQGIAAPTVIAPQANYTDYVTQRQTVDLLVNEALQAFKNPSRVSDAGFTGKLPSNLEIVAQKLLQAHKLEPYRVDLLFSAASAYIYNNDVEKALTIYRDILDVAPDDIDALIYLSAWSRFAGKTQDSESYLKKLNELNPNKALELAEFYKVIDRVTTMPITDNLSPELQKQLRESGDNTAIVTLGYALNPDGSMHDILIKRLEKTLQIAKELPDSIILVTGGVPQNNKTEGKLMADWLLKNGIDGKRIYQDNYARTTVENALYSRYALAKHRIKNTVLISSGSHIRRADAIFTLASWETGPRDIQFYGIVALDKPLAELQKVSQKDIQGIYRDGLKALGLWSFRSYPLEER
ncbi:ElyC/SanA/YdcF family protein [Providencia sp.]|uniref:ElyC/SanA/YdcF family protein n=1 Tax=Providencia sp. TaxID=589 RepID=UPI000E8EA91C|nr:ElyC/SanA/YdcF family protein [Providencia sp.]MBP6080358.1 YdcF family protein [Providencia sp.]HBO22031.1 transporter [Providencia sp.]